MEYPCDRCNEAPAITYNDARGGAICETCASYDENHVCAGDNCVCIGGDEDKTPYDTDEFDTYGESMADADAPASAGWGTDEQYGYFGGED